MSSLPTNAISFNNKTNQPFSFEATILTAQGHHITIRKSCPAAVSTLVPIPAGVSLLDVANSPQVQIEYFTYKNANYTISAAAASASQIATAANPIVVPGLIGALSNHYTLEYAQQTATGATQIAASVATPGACLGIAHRAGSLYRLYLTSPTAAGAGESYTVTSLRQNGTVLTGFTPPTIPNSSPARTVYSVDLTSLALPVNDGDFFEAILAVTAQSTLVNIRCGLQIATN